MRTSLSNAQKINLVSSQGERFSYYHCDEFCIGSGAMGEVYKGWCADYPEQKVAIKKVYNRHAENPQIRDRAKYEASLSINHPNLIRMLGYCEFDRQRGPVFIVSELIRGETIDKFVTGIELSMRADIVSRMICSALDALACLHSQNPPVWHRDLKPSNIMVENARNIKIMDLGIATSDGISFGTLEGRGFGTYPYAPPEQITGQRNMINATSDLYSLGITFYELLTGVNPFAGGSDVDILERQITMNLPHNKCIPPRLFKVLLKATAKKQSDRYQSAQAFKEAILQAIQPSQGIHSQWVLAGGIIAVALLLITLVLILLNI
ncbi:MAG: serine/threonine protein kinase [Tannerellaceae bacterium]|jgi:serine/threonine-protein kinase|nr:serine/threonine protein kinase [Tannerellaceae bacterium]